MKIFIANIFLTNLESVRSYDDDDPYTQIAKNSSLFLPPKKLQKAAAAVQWRQKTCCPWSISNLPAHLVHLILLVTGMVGGGGGVVGVVGRAEIYLGKDQTDCKLSAKKCH